MSVKMPPKGWKIGLLLGRGMANLSPLHYADTPGIYKYTSDFRFTARTCLICQDDSPEGERLLGCVEWGYTVTEGAVESGMRQTTLIAPNYQCGGNLGGSGNTVWTELKSTMKRWDENQRTNTDEEWKVARQLQR